MKIQDRSNAAISMRRKTARSSLSTLAMAVSASAEENIRQA
jgi:hypothetical protein